MSKGLNSGLFARDKVSTSDLLAKIALTGREREQRENKARAATCSTTRLRAAMPVNLVLLCLAPSSPVPSFPPYRV